MNNTRPKNSDQKAHLLDPKRISVFPLKKYIALDLNVRSTKRLMVRTLILILTFYIASSGIDQIKIERIEHRTNISQDIALTQLQLNLNVPNSCSAQIFFLNRFFNLLFYQIIFLPKVFFYQI